jgi:hypothetical protein
MYMETIESESKKGVAKTVETVQFHMSRQQHSEYCSWIPQYLAVTLTFSEHTCAVTQPT